MSLAAFALAQPCSSSKTFLAPGRCWALKSGPVFGSSVVVLYVACCWFLFGAVSSYEHVDDNNYLFRCK